MIRLPILINAAVCSACGGECCKRMPGLASPVDFPDLAVLEAGLRSGRWTFDQWDGDPADCGDDALPRVLLPRPAIVGQEAKPHHAPWRGGPCTFHSEAGCEMKHEARPIQCRELVPSMTRDCRGGPDKIDLALLWRPFVGELEAMLVRVSDHLQVALSPGPSERSMTARKLIAAAAGERPPVSAP